MCISVLYGNAFARNIPQIFIFAGEAEAIRTELPPLSFTNFKSCIHSYVFERWYCALKAGTFIRFAAVHPRMVRQPTSSNGCRAAPRDYDALHDQVAQTYEMKDAETLAHFGIATDEQKDQVNEIVDNMKSAVADATTQAEWMLEKLPFLQISK
ncbi:MAG: hypothetical protein ACLTJ8_05260 [Veillonella atypica]